MINVGFKIYVGLRSYWKTGIQQKCQDKASGFKGLIASGLEKDDSD